MSRLMLALIVGSLAVSAGCAREMIEPLHTPDHNGSEDGPDYDDEGDTTQKSSNRKRPDARVPEAHDAGAHDAGTRRDAATPSTIATDAAVDEAPVDPEAPVVDAGAPKAPTPPPTQPVTEPSKPSTPVTPPAPPPSSDNGRTDTSTDDSANDAGRSASSGGFGLPLPPGFTPPSWWDGGVADLERLREEWIERLRRNR